MVLTRTDDIDKDLLYIQGLMVLTSPMLLTKTHGIPESHMYKRAECYPYAGFTSGD